MNKEELLAQMEALAEAGDKKAFEAFAIKHFTEFPEEVQSKLLFNFFSEALEKQANEKGVELLQQEGLKAIEELAQIKAEASQERN